VSRAIQESARQPVATACATIHDMLPLPAQQLPQECTKYTLPKINTTISTDKIKCFFRRWKENTATSPSGCTSHYKLMLLHDKEDSLNLNDNFWLGITAILNGCIQCTHSLTQWHMVHNTMIFKTQGDNRIDKMRVIHIFKADYNMRC
jgi:hypothetical protein